MPKDHRPKPCRKRKPAKVPRQRIGDYRVFVGAFPTGEMAESLQKTREEIDSKTAQITPPHVTIAGTYWRNGKPTQAGAQGLINRLETLSGTLKAFDLQLGGIQTFGERVIYLGIHPSEPMLTIRRALMNTIGKDKHRRFRPHLTLAMRLKQPAFNKTLLTLRDSEWHHGRFSTPITELYLMQRGPDDPIWRNIHTIHLL